MKTNFIRLVDCDLEELLALELVAEAVGARPGQLQRLARLGLLETVSGEGGELLIPARSVMHLRRVQRLRRDLGVNYAGADIILDLVERVERLNHEVTELRHRFERD